MNEHLIQVISNKFNLNFTAASWRFDLYFILEFVVNYLLLKGQFTQIFDFLCLTDINSTAYSKTLHVLRICNFPLYHAKSLPGFPKSLPGLLKCLHGFRQANESLPGFPNLTFSKFFASKNLNCPLKETIYKFV